MTFARSDQAKHIAIAIELTHSVAWHSDCCSGILQYGQEQGWHCRVDPFLVGSSIESSHLGYDGVVGRLDELHGQIIDEHQLPAVNHFSQSKRPDLPSVNVDMQASGRQAAEHLINSGYRSFGMLRLENIVNRAYEEGFKNTLVGRGFKPPKLIELSPDFEEKRETSLIARQRTIDWLRSLDKPAGVLAINLSKARFLADTCPVAGFRTPQDIGILSSQNDTVIASNLKPTLSAIDFDFFGQGYQAAAMLDKLMSGLPTNPLHRLIPPRRIITRDTTDVFLSEDPVVSEAMRFISEHSQETLQIGQILEALHVSRRTLQRKFMEVIGRSVASEITRQRSDYMKRLLIDSDLPIVRLSEQCGFGSASQFSQYFTKAVGMSPTEYRKLFDNQ